MRFWNVSLLCGPTKCSAKYPKLWQAWELFDSDINLVVNLNENVSIKSQSIKTSLVEGAKLLWWKFWLITELENLLNVIDYVRKGNRLEFILSRSFSDEIRCFIQRSTWESYKTRELDIRSMNFNENFFFHFFISNKSSQKLSHVKKVWTSNLLSSHENSEIEKLMVFITSSFCSLSLLCERE